MTTLLLVTALGLSSTLLVSGLGKLPRARAATTSGALAEAGLRASPRAVRMAACLEIVLAAGLVATSGPAATAAAVAVLVLLTGYTVVLVRARRSGGDAGCGCHGQDSDRVTGWTLARNGVLLAAAASLLVGFLRGGSTRAWAAEHALETVVAVAAVVVALVALALAGGKPATPARNRGEVVATEPLPAAPGDYVRWPVPGAPLLDASGRRSSLRDLVRVSARLVVVVDGRQGAAPDARRWLTRVAPRASVVRPALVVAHAAPSELSSWDCPAESDIFADPPGVVAAMLGGGVLPSVTILGADGWLAGGPASGVAAVEQLLSDLEAELAIADRAVAESAVGADPPPPAAEVPTWGGTSPLGPGLPGPNGEDRRPADP